MEERARKAREERKEAPIDHLDPEERNRVKEMSRTSADNGRRTLSGKGAKGREQMTDRSR